MLPIGGLQANWSAALTRQLMETLHVNGSIQQVIIPGDIAYSDDGFGHLGTLLNFSYEEVMDGWFGWIENISTTRPFMVAAGNHESEDREWWRRGAGGGWAGGGAGSQPHVRPHLHVSAVESAHLRIFTHCGERHYPPPLWLAPLAALTRPLPAHLHPASPSYQMESGLGAHPLNPPHTTPTPAPTPQTAPLRC